MVKKSKDLRPLLKKTELACKALKQRALQLYVKDSLVCSSPLYRGLLMEIKKLEDHCKLVERTLKQWEDS